MSTLEVARVDSDDDHLPDGVTPLKNISDHSPVDVLCGRGGGTNHHTGNNHWRALVSANKRLYISLPKKQKVLVARSIVHAIRSQVNPHGGRFLQKDAGSGLWNDIGDQTATEKTSQALREGAPDIRAEMEQGDEPGKKVEDGVANKDESNGYLGSDASAPPGAASGYKPGQILPNGLITLDYEGVQMAIARSARPPLQDGTIDIYHTLPPVETFTEAVQQLGAPPPVGPSGPPGPPQPLDPMMAAFQQFMGVQVQQQRNGNSTAAPGTPSADPVSAFQKILVSGSTGQVENASPPALPPMTDAAVPKNVEQRSSIESRDGTRLQQQKEQQKQQQQQNDAPVVEQHVRPNPLLAASRRGSADAPGPTAAQTMLARETSETLSIWPRIEQEGSLSGMGLEAASMVANKLPGLRREGSMSGFMPGDAGARPGSASQVGALRGTTPGSTEAVAAHTSALLAPAGDQPTASPVPPPTAPVRRGPSMTREMALQILLREKAQKAQRARDDAAAAAIAVQAAGREAILRSSYLQSLGAAAGGGRLPAPAGQLNGQLRSSQMLVHYIGQRNSTSVAPTAATVPLPLLGNISSMTDEQIREALRQLEWQRPGMGGVPPPSSLQGPRDSFDLTGLARNQSSGSARAPGADLLHGGTRPVDVSGSMRGRLGQAERDNYPADYQQQNSSFLAGGGAGTGAADAHLHHQPLQSSSSLALSQQQHLAPALVPRESLGLQQAILDAMRHLGSCDTTTLEAGESLGPTPLRPGVSAALAQMKMAGLSSSQSLGQHDALSAGVNGSDGKAGGSSTQSNGLITGEGDRRVFWVPPPAAAAAMTSSNAAPGAHVAGTTVLTALGDKVTMTSSLQRGETAGSLDDLCRAAGMYLTSEAEEKGVKGPSGKSPSNGAADGAMKSSLSHDSSSSGLSLKMKLFQGLMGSSETQPMSSHIQPQPRRTGLTLPPASVPFAATPLAPVVAAPPVPYPTAMGTSASDWALAQEWENVKKVSSARRAALQLGKNDQSLVDDSDDEEEYDKPMASLSTRRRGRPQSNTGTKRAVKRRAPASPGTKAPPNGGVRNGGAPKMSTARQGRNDLVNGCVPRPLMAKQGQNGLVEGSALGLPPAIHFRNSLANDGALGVSLARHGRNDLANGTSAPSLATCFSRGVSFLRVIRELPVAETILDRGHSLAMSEISLDRGQSLGAEAAGASAGPPVGDGGVGGEEDGQFDDASEDDEQGETDIFRGMTLGTVHTTHTFSSLTHVPR